MKQLMGCVAAAGLLATAATAQAQVLVPYRTGERVVVASDFGGPYAAMPREMGPRYGYAPPVLPPQEIYAILRENGFSPLGAPQQRGLVYTISAIDRDGEDGRLVIDARDGSVLRFMPATRMGSRMGEEVVTTYGPVGALPPMPDDRRALPRPPVVAPRVASRTPTVPLPKAPPVRAVATPKAVAAPVAVTPAPTPVQQTAVTPPKTDEVRVIPLTAAPAAAAPAPAAPTVAAPSVEAAPATPPPTEAAPPAQGLE